ncbi:unnamed protein product [Merluccius merluccius]
MKESSRAVREEQLRMDAHRNGRRSSSSSCVWPTVSSAGTDGTRAQDRPAQRMNRSPGGGPPPGPRASADVRLAAASRRGAFTVAAAARGVLLPPIPGSTALSRKEDEAVGVSASVPYSLARLSDSIVMRESAALRVLVARHKKRTETSDRAKGSALGVSFRALGKDLVSGPAAGGDLDRAKSPVAAATPALMELKIGPQKSDACPAAAAEPNTGLLKADPQRALWDDSDAETESQGSQGNATWRNSRWLDENDEYYTRQRIAEWVGKVNSTLFNTVKENLESLNPVEEQDTTTIKIIYDGD